MDLNKIKLDRRGLLKAAGMGVAATGLSGPIMSALANAGSVAGTAKLGKDGKRLLPWSNWSGSQTSLPSLRLAPGSEDELIDMVKTSTQTIRCVGAGHSFNGLVPTDDTLMTLARMRGLESVNLETQEANIWAGTQLGEIGEPLWEHGLAMINMPDINVQSLAGAIGTSTHGTGKHLGSISSTVTSLRLVTANGELMECSADKNSDLFQAARTSLGSLGVVSQARLQTQDAYNLRERTWFVPLEEGLDQIEDYRDNHRNYEAYFFPHGDYMMHITQEEIGGDIPSIIAGAPSDGYETFRQISEVIDYVPMFMYSTLMNFGLRAELEGVEIKEGRSYQVYPTVRDMRFNEMEYSIPAEHGVDCIREILATIKKLNIDIIFPMEYRYVPADDIWLSPFYGRDTCAISCHQFHDRDYKPYFAEIEPIFHKYEGRPHQGKLHTLSAPDFAALYPKWDDFLEVRQEIDPEGKFLNSFLKRVLGVA